MVILIEQHSDFIDIFNILKDTNQCHLFSNGVYNALYKFNPRLYIGHSNVEYNCHKILLNKTVDGFNFIVRKKSPSFLQTDCFVKEEYFQQTIILNKIFAEKYSGNTGFSADLACHDEPFPHIMMQAAAHNDFRTLIFGPHAWKCSKYVGPLNEQDLPALYSSAKVIFTEDLQKAVNISMYTLCATNHLEAGKYGLLKVNTTEDLINIVRLYSKDEKERLKKIEDIQRQIKVFVPTYKNILRIFEEKLGIELL